MAAPVVVEILKAKKFALQFASIPKRYEVEILCTMRFGLHALYTRYVDVFDATEGTAKLTDIPP